MTFEEFVAKWRQQMREYGSGVPREAIDMAEEAWKSAHERCAKICEARRQTVSNGSGVSYYSHDPASVEAGYCADAIRRAIEE